MTAASPLVRIGCAGWNINRDAVASFPSEGSHLERYAQRFNCCEINSSFYRPHKNETWARWARSVPMGFKFSVKAPKAITHEARLNCAPDSLTAFFEQIEFLDEKLGPILIQLPPSLQFDYSIATRFLTLLRGKFQGDVVWEARHATWFSREVEDVLKQFQIAQVAADPACVPAASDPGGSPHLAYYRLHGSPRLYYSDYSGDSLDRLAAQLKERSARSSVWCIFDNTAAQFAIPNAIELQQKIGR
jgi:uncharacterized protein YecE (DUF72 family)